MTMAQQPIAPPVRPSGFLALMRNRDYAVLWTSQGISLLGDRFQWVAMSLWVYALTGSALSVSYAVIALMVGPAAVGLLSGVLVDRWNRKWTMIFADFIRGILVALIPWLMTHDIRLVYLDLFLVSCATAFFRPAMLAILPQTVPKADLLPANSFFTAVDTATEVVGPVLAGVLVQARGYSSAMYIDSASYLVSAVLLMFLRVGPIPIRSFSSKASTMFGDFMEGLRYIRRDRVQFGLLVLLFFGWWLSGFNSLQTPLAKGVLSLTDTQFGFFNGIWGSGFVIASLLLGWYGTRLSKGRLIATSFLGWAAATGGAGLALNAGMLYAAVFWVGFMNIILFVTLSTTIMEITPSDMLGRVFTARQVALALVRVAAMLGFGLLADLSSVRLAILSMAGVSVLGIVTGLLLFPEVGKLGGPMVTKGLFIPKASKSGWAARQVLGLLIDSRDSSYGTDSQRAANTAALLIVATAWGGLLLRNAKSGAFILLAAVVAIAFKPMHAAWTRWQGSKNVRQRSAAAERESDDGRRTPVATGPTSE